jgi:M6 family metalloprotease-like protein
MKPIKCLTYVLCLVAALVTISPAQSNLGSDQIRQHRLALQRVLGAFADWAKRNASKTGGEPNRQALQEGLVLAKERRVVLRQLMESDPELALSASIAQSVRSRLPSQIQNELETPVSGTGDLMVLCDMPALGCRDSGGIRRVVRLNGKTHRAVVYGRRANQTTKYNIPLHGIVVDGVLALDEHVLGDVTADEAAGATGSIVDVTAGAGQAADSGQAVFASMGGTLYRFASAAHLRQSEELLETAESGPAAKLDQPSSVLLERSGLRPGQLRNGSRPLIAPASGGTSFEILVVRVDFSDLPGDPRPLSGAAPYTASYIQQLADGQVAPYYQHSSYGRATLKFTVTPQLYRLPGTAAHYSTSIYPFELYNDAVTAAQADYSTANYDKVVVLFSWLGSLPGSQVQFGGLSLIGTSMAWVNGEFDFRVVAHELGHTFGLFHANFWHNSDGNPVSLSGSSVEYTDPFDTMGANWANDGRADFNPWFKHQLNWIQDSQVQTVTQSGTYRVYRFDDAQATGTLALKATKDSVRDYWIGYRRNFLQNAGLQNGAYVVWGYHQPEQSNLLGLGPEVNIPKDPGLQVGSILADPQANLTITPVGEGGVAPHEYLDVQITFGPPPMITRQPDSQVALDGESVQFSVEATANTGYAWQRQANGTHDWVTLSDGNGYSGTSTPTLQIAASMMMNGDAFRCVLTNAEGGLNGTQPVTLTVSEFGVQTVVGQPGVRGNANGVGALAQLSYPMGIAVDRAGNLYIADTGNHVIRKVSPTGLVSTLAGLAGVAGTADGVGEEARFDMPIGITVDSAGVLYVVDQYDSTVRRITPDGAVTTVQPVSAEAANTTETATSPGLNHPSGIAVDCYGNLYIADTGNNTIRRMAPDGSLSTLAGANGAPGSADGPGPAARFNGPFGIAVDLDGDVYVADQGNSTIRKITADGIVTTIAGIAGDPGSTNGVGAAAQLSFPAGLAVDDFGNVYVADRNNSTIRKIDSAGNVSTLAGVPGTDGSADGASATAQFNFPVGLAVGPSGEVYVADTAANTIRMIRTAVSPGPMLRMKIVGNLVMLYWPASTSGYNLWSRSDLSTNGKWVPAEIATVIQGCYFVATTRLQTPAAFFRLQHQ